MATTRARCRSLSCFVLLGLLLSLIASPPAQAAPGFDVIPLTLLPGVDVRPDFDPRFTAVDHNGTIYIWSSRVDGSARGVYRLLGNTVEPFLIKDQQVLVQQLSGITTLLTIDHVLPAFVDAAGRVYFQNNADTTPPGGVSHLLRQELGGGLTLLDTQGPTSGPGNVNYLGQVLSDGRWLRQSWERESGVDIFIYTRTNGTSSQQLLRRPQFITTCEGATKSTDYATGLLSNAQGKSIIRRDRSTETYQRSDCSGRRLTGVYTQTLEIVGGNAHVALDSSDSNAQHTLRSYQLNDAGQILHAAQERIFDPTTSIRTITFRLFKNNTLVHTLSVNDDPDELVESSFDHAQLLPDGSVLYSVPPNLPGQPAAGGLFRDGQLVIAGNDPLFAQPVVFGRMGQINSRGEVIAFWRAANATNIFGYVLLSKALGRWTNGNGGAWSDATNWAGDDVPGQSQSALFSLANTYTVATGTGQVGSVEITDGEVTWNAGQLDIIGGLQIGAREGQGQTTLRIDDRVQVGEVTIGHLPLSDSTGTEMLSSIQIGPDARLAVSGPLVLGAAGRAGFGLFGGQLTTGETRLGVGAVGTFNTLFGENVWNSGSLLVGESYPGFINFRSGALQSSSVRIGGAAFSPNFDLGVEPFSRVSIDGFGEDENGNPTAATSWSVQQELEVGSGHPGKLVITDGGSTQVGSSLTVDNITPNLPAAIMNWSSILVSGRAPINQQPATLLIGEDLLLGNSDGAGSELTISAGGIVDIGRTLSIGHQPSFPSVFVVGTGSTLTAGQEAGSGCTIGFGGGGELVVSDGGTFRCLAPLKIGLGDDGANVTITSASSLVRAQRIEVGAPASAEPQATGTITLKGGRITADETLTIWENGTLAGSGDIQGTIINNGSFEPGLEPLAPEGGMQTQTSAFGAQPGTLTITGSVSFAPQSSLMLDIVGANQYDQLQINGSVQIDGTLTLAFSEGYAPKTGDIFTFITSSATAGDFTAVMVTGLAPGWQYILKRNGGITTLSSNNDAIATTSPTLRSFYLPMISR